MDLELQIILQAVSALKEIDFIARRRTERRVEQKVPTENNEVTAYLQGLPRPGAFVQDMGIDHGGLDVGVAEEFLDGADVLSGLQQMGGEAVPKAVRREANRQPALPDGLLNRPLNKLFVNMVTSGMAAAGVLREWSAAKTYCQPH